MGTGNLGNQVGYPCIAPHFPGLQHMASARKRGLISGHVLVRQRPRKRPQYGEKKYLEALSSRERGWQEVGSSRNLFSYSGGSCHCDTKIKPKHYLDLLLPSQCVWTSYSEWDWDWDWGLSET